MRKFLASLLLLVTLLPFAAKADELTVNDGTLTNNVVPMYVFYFDAFTRSQYVIPAEDLAPMIGGEITAIKYYTTTSNVPFTTNVNVNIYMTEVDYTTISAYVNIADAQVVYTGTVTFPASQEAVITFDTPYQYNGGNLLIGCDNTAKGTYKSIYFYGKTSSGSSIGGSNSTSANNAPATARNFLPKVTFTYSGATVPSTTLTTNPTNLNLGDRPNNAWMAPYQFEIYNAGTPGTINSIEANAPFVVAAELPATIGYKETIPAEVTIGETEATGATSGEILVMFDAAKEFTTFNVNANLYTAETPDVWEKAQVVSTFPYTGTAPTTIYKNYDIPHAAAAAKDAVYKVTFEDDVVLNASATDGAVAIYAEDFGGQPGPMVDNVYTGPTSGGGSVTPYDAWLYYDDGVYSGSMGAGGTIYWAVNFPASELAQASNCSVTKAQVYDAGYTGGTSAVLVYQDGVQIGSQSFSFDGAGAWQEITFDTPVAFDNTKDLMIAVYNTGITYPAAGCAYVSTIGDNGDLVSFDGVDWNPLSAYGYYYTWMIRAYVQTPGGAKTTELTHFKGNVSNGELSEMVADQPIVTNPNIRANTPDTYAIEDMFVKAGTYYLVCASTTDKFEVNIATGDLPVPEPAVVTAPENGATNVTSPVTLQWTLGNYTSEMQVLFGTQFPPTDILIDWTDQLVTSTTVNNLQNNKTYFIMVNARNSAGVTESEVYGFTTPIDEVQGFAVANDKLYPGDVAEFSWEANRTLQGYNLYQDGVKLNEEPITGTEYTVEGLEYNMTGYSFQISSLYGEGESELSEPIVVKMTGVGNVSGNVYEQDETTPVAGITVEFRGTDEYGANQSFTFTTDENGAYAGDVLAGNYQTYAYSDAYQESPGPAVTVAYQDELEDIDIIIYEYYFPLGQIRATEQTEENNVLVEWDWTPAELIVDFETGDFSQAEFNLPATYPWTVTTTNPNSGTYCMKSTCEGVASGTSEIEVTVDVPFDAKMGFYVRVSTESGWDKFYFYIDGVQQGSDLSGNNPYTYKEYTVAQGTHTYKWSYQKDGSVNSNDDCVYVDDITMYRQDVPAPPVIGATDYNFDDGTLMGWTNIDADGDGNVWVSSSNPGIYHNAGVSLSGTGHNSSEAYVISGSYANQTGAVLYPDNYFVSPQISAEDGALVRFYVCAQDASYAAEHYGVAVSTTGNTNSADFTTIAEWTLSAKNVPQPYVENSRDFRGTTAQGAWYEHTIDLSAYAGQDIYVAIRHFQCSDQFILNLDDITLATGGTKELVRSDRSLQHFNLYRRDIQNGEETATILQIAQPSQETFSYIDESWADLPYGVYQWGIQAYYEGNAPRGNRDDVTYDFEGGLNGWTVLKVNSDGGEWIHSDDNVGGYDYTELAHGGTGFAMCYSFVDYVGAFNTDSYMVSPQKYTISANSTLTFWADNANDEYPESFSVCVATTAGAPTASDFTQVWGGEAKAGANEKAAVRHTNNRYENWRQHTVNLGAYAGQEVWIAFHDVNEDMYEIWIDDVTISSEGGAPVPPPGPTASLVIDFETGDFSQYEFVNEGTYPWVIETSDGNHFIKSSNEGFASSESTIEATVEFVADGSVSFDAICMGEGSSTAWDKCLFYIDGVEKMKIGAGNSEWVNKSYNVTAGTHTFTWTYSKDSSVNPTGDYFAVDNITFEGVEGAAPTPVAGDGLSEILWSNAIEKDMYSTVTVEVVLNNGQPTNGVAVALGDNTATMDETGTIVFENVRKGEYELNVTMAEFADYNETVMIDEDEESFRVVLIEIVGPVADLYVSPTGWAMWSGATSSGGSGGGGGGGGGGNASSFTEGFESGLPSGWNVIDGNNDGNTWCLTSAIPSTWTYYASLTLDWYRTGTNAICSGSYINGVGAINPDEYLVMPQVTLGAGSTLSFWAAATDASYPAEHFGVFVSDNGTSDWTSVQEWTLTGKSGGTDGGRASRDGKGAKLGTWHQFTADLSAYAGQKYIAIRHFNCYDQYIMVVDDIELTSGSKADRGALSFKVMLDGAYEGETTYGHFQHNVEGFEEGSVHTTSVAGIYATGMGEWTDYTWTYTSCENFAGASNVTAEQSENVVNIAWEMPNAPGPGPTPPPAGGTAFTEDFESGLNGWTVLTLLADGGEWVHSSNNPGGYDYTTHAHGGTGFALCYSFVDYVGAYNTDSYLITPQTYSIVNGSTLHFWADNANDSYPENFSVCVSTAATPATAADFTQVWSGGAKGTGNGGAAVRHSNNRYDNWREHTVDLSAYAGQTVWIAFHDVNYDAYEIWIDDVELSAGTKGGRTVVYEPHFVTDPGAMANGADASWIKGSQSTWGPNCNNGGGYKMADDFTLDAATTISEIEVYGYQTGSTTTSTFTGLFAQIYNGAPNAGGTVVWGDETTNIMTATSFTNCYRGSDGETTATTRPIMAITASGLNISLEAGTYYLVWSLAGSASSGPWAAPEALPNVGNTGNGLQLGTSGWANLTDSGSGTPYGAAFKLVGEGGGTGPTPTPGEFGILGAYVFRNGELISGETPLTTTTFVDADAPAGDNEYCVRVVYDGARDTTYYAMSCPVCAEAEYECIPVNNLVAEYTYNSAEDYGVTLTWECEFANDVLYYNVYYSDTIVSGITELEYYVEMTGNPGVYTFSVTAVYPNCESEPVYAEVDVTSVNDISGKVVLYPNPTNSTVNIEAAGMKHITVVNALGQVVYDTDLSADMIQLNLGQYKPGIYMVRINTEEGVSVKRVTVVK